MGREHQATGQHLMQGGRSSACQRPPWALPKLCQLAPISHLLHDLLFHKEEMHTLRFTLLRLLTCVPVESTRGCFVH